MLDHGQSTFLCIIVLVLKQHISNLFANLASKHISTSYNNPIPYLFNNQYNYIILYRSKALVDTNVHQHVFKELLF